MTVIKGELSATAETSIFVEPGEAGWVVIAGGTESLSSLDTKQITANPFE
ncbi:MAG TPA: hypothetical protein DCL17_07015, partial [Dehalococcoidia bacterium]|nr:hypothetical protein [Dehalococcoidia bacterium]